MTTLADLVARALAPRDCGLTDPTCRRGGCPRVVSDGGWCSARCRTVAQAMGVAA